MARQSNRAEGWAAEAAARIDGVRQSGQQLSLLPDEGRAPGQPVRGEGKASSQLRRWLAAQGLRLPEEILADVAGLSSADDAVVTAMAKAEKLLAWAEDGATVVPGAPKGPTMRMRLEAFQLFYAAALRAAEAALPYGLAKVTPETVTAQQVNQIIVQGDARVSSAPAGTGPGVRDVTPGTRRIAPPPMPEGVQRNQGLGDSGAEGSDP